MPETVRVQVHLQQNNPNRNFKLIDTVANGGWWLDADNGHTLTSDGLGAVTGVLRFGLEHPNSGYFAVAVGRRDNNDPWGDVITGPPATQSAQSVLELYNTGIDRDMISWIQPLERDVTSADKASVTGPKIGD